MCKRKLTVLLTCDRLVSDVIKWIKNHPYILIASEVLGTPVPFNPKMTCSL